MPDVSAHRFEVRVDVTWDGIDVLPERLWLEMQQLLEDRCVAAVGHADTVWLALEERTSGVLEPRDEAAFQRVESLDARVRVEQSGRPPWEAVTRR
jgi:hypothetical protein